MSKLDDLERVLRRAITRARHATSDFDLTPDVALPPQRRLRPAAVLVAVSQDGRVVLTKRATHLKHHPGQIAFAGGRKEDWDADLVDTALREAQEEIGLDPAAARVLGTLPTHETVTNFSVTPVVALLPPGLTFRPEPGEVAEIFEVPLSHVLQPANFRVEGRYWNGHRRQYYTLPYGPFYIWGATARMLRNLAEGAA
ncbi:CoA pyrophosphatase [Thalassorhabdomicrobium marinisediminis]|uniref:CoA pyrophosphatase n=1 Tax=Thalassorhabdomicrobium marinisediminis TaxID=2170577 RepID=A0A2T7FZS6_9RHOB|nr:CoA pyrophosphatase [Thalassorhabdomicrobium marinisediminis]PVA07674.1 CoA pyrophosphatase [Thalassorhabdomicrobium marinisediminis]